MNAAGFRAQTLYRDPGEIEGANHFENAEQHQRLLDDQANAQQGIPHVNQNSRANAEGRQQGVATALAQRLAKHHGKVWPWAGYGQEMNEGDGDEFRPVVVHTFYLQESSVTGRQSRRRG
eukprot:TRINITY_DN4963_c0_g1_i1.p2 TRINITY_DN4963_c0_g1~~TRINITY_DN4963_c0_g1_i1.p2  ORF type:complete len:141 (+),score=12.62 TRINITY_DN4963_c0_g1_i1:65-424(+)